MHTVKYKFLLFYCRQLDPICTTNGSNTFIWKMADIAKNPQAALHSRYCRFLEPPSLTTTIKGDKETLEWMPALHSAFQHSLPSHRRLQRTHRQCPTTAAPEFIDPVFAKTSPMIENERLGLFSPKLVYKFGHRYEAPGNCWVSLLAS